MNEDKLFKTATAFLWSSWFILKI